MPNVFCIEKANFIIAIIINLLLISQLNILENLRFVIFIKKQYKYFIAMITMRFNLDIYYIGAFESNPDLAKIDCALSVMLENPGALAC